MELDKLMEFERLAQDSELEKALKERIDRRKRALEKKHKKDIQQAFVEAKKDVVDTLAGEKKLKEMEIDAEYDAKAAELL